MCKDIFTSVDYFTFSKIMRSVLRRSVVSDSVRPRGLQAPLSVELHTRNSQIEWHYRLTVKQGGPLPPPTPQSWGRRQSLPTLLAVLLQYLHACFNISPSTGASEPFLLSPGFLLSKVEDLGLLPSFCTCVPSPPPNLLNCISVEMQ